MERRLKERLTGAAVLILLAVIFIPMILDNSVQDETRITESNIPPRQAAEPVTRTIPPPPDISSAGRSAESTETVNDADEGKVAEAEPATAEIARENDNDDDTDTAPIQEQTDSTTDESVSEEQTSGLNAWVVQLGSFASHENATSLVEKLREQGYPAFMEEVSSGDEVVHRVRIGPEVRREDAEKTLDELTARLDLEGIILRYR